MNDFHSLERVQFENRPARPTRAESNCEKMARLCEEFGLSRKTGYKSYERYRDIGVPGLVGRSRRPLRHANSLPLIIEKSIVRLKREYPSRGAPKIRQRLKHRWPEVQCPASARSTRCS